MVSVYDIYLDIFVFDNIMANLFVLMVISLVMGSKISAMRMMAASLIGAVVSVAILVFRIRYGIGYVATVITSQLAMLYAMGISKRKSPKGLIYMNTVSFAFSKLNSCIEHIVGRRTLPVTAMTLVAALGAFLGIYGRRLADNTICKVVLLNGGRCFRATALYDSGNLLKEPVTGKAVSIIEKSAILDDWLKNTPEKFKIIPYKSVGRENGILEGMEIERLVIQHDESKVVRDGAVIAFYEGKLSEDGRFSMILNHDLL